MSKPKCRKLTTEDEKVMSLSKQRSVKFREFMINEYVWNESGEKTVLLVHGWEGLSGNFSKIISQLVTLDYKVIAYDAPSHGKSSKGKTHMFAFSQFLIEQLNNISPSIIISHSFGSVTTAMMLNKHKAIKVDQWLMITTPYTFRSKLERVAKKFCLNQTVLTNIEKLIETEIKIDVENLNMAQYCKELENVERALIVHSKLDKVLPIEWSRQVNQEFKQCELIELEELGHYNILRSEDLSQIINGYLVGQKKAAYA
jgi:pimeloyl-ACP methyl ester carboxylesterase